jgi:hypothetical protein
LVQGPLPAVKTHDGAEITSMTLLAKPPPPPCRQCRCNNEQQAMMVIKEMR